MTGSLPSAEVAAAIWESDATGEPIPAAIAGIELDRAAAEAVQLQVLAAHVAAGDTVGGWKVGNASGPGRDALGAGVRPFGVVRGSRAFPSGSRIPFADITGPGIEIEVGVRIGRTLGGAHVTREEALAAIDGVAPTFEILHTRLQADASDGVKLANVLQQWGIVVSETVPWTGPIDELVGRLERDGEQIGTNGPGYAIDDPIASVIALCAELAPFGLALLPGQTVITGAWVAVPVEGPGAWVGGFPGLGEVRVEFV